MSNAIKIELIASLLRSRSHDVEVISQGEVIENGVKFYPSFSESERFHRDIPVLYASALPVRRVNAFWSTQQTLRVFKERHQAAPFDVVIIFNLKEPQVGCANYAIRRLRIPAILEYEDDRFVNVTGSSTSGFISSYRDRACRKLFQAVSGCIGVSPHLLSQLPGGTPKMLLRGVVGTDLLTNKRRQAGEKRNWILFSGTHIESNGVAQLIEAWRSKPIDGWELHITGYGGLTNSLQKMAENVPKINFHGLVSRQELVELLCSAKICINPHAVSRTPGNVFAFKIIEYLAAGAHCITTPMGALEPDLEAGITYMPDNSPGTITATLKRVIEEHRYEQRAGDAAERSYGPQSVSSSLTAFLQQVLEEKRRDRA